MRMNPLKKRQSGYSNQCHIGCLQSIKAILSIHGSPGSLTSSYHIQYPTNAAKANIEGRVIVEFIIDKNGAVTAPKVVRGINDSLNNEALRVIKSMPLWTPGYAQGKPVKTRYTYPVAFKLAKAK